MRREYPSHPLAAVGAAIVDGSKMLLVKRGQEPGKGLWSIPGGLVELGETVRDAVRREAREETGIDVQIERLLDVVDSIVRDDEGKIRFHYVLMDFLARPCTTLVRPLSDVSEVRWVDFRDIRGYSLTTGAEKLVRMLSSEPNADCSETFRHTGSRS